jgi:predicted transcriptional regulator
MKAKATINELLVYMWRMGVTRPFDLTNDFGYTYNGATCMLSLLKKRGLVLNDRRGEWVVTRRGEQRLVHIGVKL